MMRGSFSRRVVPPGSGVVVVMLVTSRKRVSVCAATVSAKRLSAKQAASTRENILLKVIDGDHYSLIKIGSYLFGDCAWRCVLLVATKVILQNHLQTYKKQCDCFVMTHNEQVRDESKGVR